MKFGKIHDPQLLDSIDFSLPPDSSRSTELLQSEVRHKFQAYIGCPMWGNKAWVGTLYPPGTKAGDYLKHYARSFNGIELNSTHYRIPTEEIVERWREMAPEGFHFSPKIPQTISHYARLFNCEPQVEAFCDAISVFEEKLGCSFVQLPPNFGFDQLNKLDWFLAGWPRHLPLAIEFRHESWFENHELKTQVLDLLEATGTTALITDVAGRRDVLHTHLTTSTAMIRFVGNGLVPTDYARADAWIDRIASWAKQGLEKLYFFVHEPDDTYAPDMGAYVIKQLNDKLGLGLVEPGIKPEPGSQMSLF
jgi:uncharacterized protein YecE (DUF72 family)